MTAGRSISNLFAVPTAPHRPIAVLPGATVTFDELERNVAALSACLKAHGGRRWLLVTGDAYALAVGFLAVLYAGGTAVLPANLQSGHLNDLIGQVDGLLCHGDPGPQNAVALQILDPGPAAPVGPLDPFDSTDAEVVLHTSGTMGRPVATSKSLACFEQELAVLEERFRPAPSSHVLATVPAHHIYGLLFRVLWPLVAGRPFASDLIRFPGELGPALRRAENSLLISSPAFLARAIDVLDLDTLDPLLGNVFCSGGPLAPDVSAAYNARLTHPIIEVYGSTETGGIGHRSVRDAARPDSWTPLPGVMLSVDQETDVLSVESPFIDKTHPFRTGDRARLLPDGRFELLGRADQIVKVEERRVSLPEIEQRLVACSEVSAARVVPLGGNVGRKVLGGVVVLSPDGWTKLANDGKRALTETLRANLAHYLDIAALPRKWRFVRAFPLTEQGKTPQSALLALFETGTSSATLPNCLSREVDGTTVRLRLELQPDLAYFDGHFDRHPVLPGVVQLDWAVTFGRREFALGDRFHRIEALKFFRIMTAHDVVSLDLTFEPEKDRLSFHYRSDRFEHSTGRLVFGPAA